MVSRPTAAERPRTPSAVPVHRVVASAAPSRSVRPLPAPEPPRAASGDSALQAALREPSHPIEPAVRRHLGDRFGYALDEVRVHDGPAAAEAARQHGAEALTVGRDIVFGGSRYQPGTPRGLELLAHEVAHTIQQSSTGGARSGEVLTVSSPGGPLEREADAAARAAVALPTGPGTAGQVLRARANGPTLSRRAIAWEPIPTGPITTPAPDPQTVTSWERPDHKNVARFQVPKLVLPKEKGPVLDQYKAAVGKPSADRASGLETTIEFEGRNVRAGLKQWRVPTPGLNRRWLIKVGWSNKEADTKWAEAGGKAGKGFFPDKNPGVVSSTCDMDHVVELQLGGTNVPSNIAPLNSKDNQASGRDIWATVSGMARALRPALPASTGMTNVILSFQDVEQAGGPVPKGSCKSPGAADCTCSDVDACATANAAKAAGAGTGGGRETYRVTTGTQTAQFMVPPGTAPVDLLGGDEANTANSEAVPGLILEYLEREKADAHLVTGFVESDKHRKRAGKTRIPILLKDAGEVKLDAVPEGDARRLKLRGEPKQLAFTYPYLSSGTLQMRVTEKGLEGDGTVNPSVPLLRGNPIKVHFGGGAFEGELSPDPAKMKLPVPGFRVTRSALKLALAPELNVTGDVDFDIGKLLSGNVHAEPSTEGLALTGTLQAHLPKLEEATGQVAYKDGELTGSLTVKSEQLANLPGKPQGQITVGLTNAGMTAEGHVEVTLPNGKPVTLDAQAARDRLLLTGKTEFDVPGLHPVSLGITYDGTHFAGTAKTGITYKGLSGDITVNYYDGALSGETDVAVTAGRVTGTAHILLASDGKIYGEGSARVRITDSVAGTIGIKKPKVGDIEVSGELELPPKIELFPGKHIDKKLFDRAFNIPVLGPVALQIKPSIGFGAGIGPATLDNTRIAAGFKPFAAEADFELDASTQLSIPAYAQLSVGIGLGLALTAGVGSIGGGVDVIGSLRLDGGVFIPFHLHYKAGVFTANADVSILGQVSVLVSIKGYLLAEAAGIELWNPTWDLWDKKFDTGLGFKLIVPITYASDKPFELPSFSQMTIEPQVSLDSVKQALLDALPPLT